MPFGSGTSGAVPLRDRQVDQEHPLVIAEEPRQADRRPARRARRCPARQQADVPRFPAKEELRLPTTLGWGILAIRSGEDFAIASSPSWARGGGDRMAGRGTSPRNMLAFMALIIGVLMVLIFLAFMIGEA